jgi:hypothetical protein
MVVERLKQCDNIVALSAELDLDRRLMGVRLKLQFGSEL